MIKQYQVTMYCKDNKYKPVSCIVEKDNVLIYKMGTEAYKQAIYVEGVEKICKQRGWTVDHIRKYGYTTMKMREYNKEKIEQEKKERYEQIKKERGWT